MRTCLQCGRPGPLNRDQCLYCGGELSDEALESHQLKCPRCGNEMESMESDGVTLDVCFQCGGTWYDPGELQQSVEGALTNFEDPQEGASDSRVQASTPEELRYLKCPRCQASMNRKNFKRISGVMVDVCHAHGVFLDGGEFEAIIEFFARGGKKKAQLREHDEQRARESRELMERQKRRKDAREAILHSRRSLVRHLFS